MLLAERSSEQRLKDAQISWWERARVRAIGIVLLAALVPAAGLALWMTRLYEGSVETTEKQLQSSVLAELSGAVVGRVHEVRTDVESVAAVIAYAASQPASNEMMTAVRAVLATKEHLSAVRFLVPTSGVDTVIRKQEAGSLDVPRGDGGACALAEQRGAGFLMIGEGRGALCLLIPPLQANAPKGYLVASVDFAPLQERLTEVSATRFSSSSTRLMIADSSRNPVASIGLVGAAPEGLWRLLPAGTPWTSRVGMISEFEVQGEPFVGGLETVPALGWVVAVWRPRAEIYRSLTRLRTGFVITIFLVCAGSVLLGVFAASAVVKPVTQLVHQAELLGQRRWAESKSYDMPSGELGLLASRLRWAAEQLELSESQLQDEERRRADLSRFLTPELVSAIVKGEHSLELGGQRREVSVLFVDVVSFTPLAERETPERVVTLLNELLSMLTEVVFRNHGTVDKFIGDCLMAVWGAPLEEPEHAMLAVRAAEEMLRFLEVSNEGWKRDYGVELQLAIGINSGEAVVGNVGSVKRMEYTVIGDMVNTAARLETLARPNQILLTQESVERAGDAARFERLGEEDLSGRDTPVVVYQVLGV